MRRLTPQEKKRLSYERDRRNTYGEAPHAARKGIPLRKALRNRANRHYQNQHLAHLGGTPDQEQAETLESLIHHRAPNNWKKFADEPLGKVIRRKLRARELMLTQGGRRALARRHYSIWQGDKCIGIVELPHMP
ncbi:MAG TPA: hypothetical protein VGO96_08515 [Pyrinomonadaceae bacterium]|jgi:hypothetical protein|nr:hypothetical protein [Pyrinomonadaceae bacterium]